jgi:hypothetical protein
MTLNINDVFSHYKSPGDLPLLNRIQATPTRLLHSLNPPTAPSSPTPGPRTTAEEAI